MRHPAAEKLEIIRLVEQSALPVRRTWTRSAFRLPPSTVGTTCTRPVDRRLWTTDIPCRIASGTRMVKKFIWGAPGRFTQW